MKVKITRVEIVEVSVTHEESEDVNLDDFTDSYQDDIMNSQAAEHETDNGDFTFIPMELVSLKMEEVK